VLGAALAAAAGGPAAAQDKTVWKVHSPFSSKVPMLGPSVKRIERTMKELSGGSFDLRIFEPGALVPANAYFEPVAAGAIDAAAGSAQYQIGKNSAFAFFTTVPFGPGFGEYLGWVQYGGGYEQYDELLAQYGVKGLFCGMTPAEAIGWFRKEVNTLEDLRGIKMRFSGFGARIMEKFGVSTQLIAAGDIYPALELGTIDATEFSSPSVDEGLGFHQVAKHYYFPGWHTPSVFMDFVVQRAKYDALSQIQKDWLRIACAYNNVETYVEGSAQQGPALERLRAKGVQFHRWSDDILERLHAAWHEVAAEEAERNPTFKKVFASYTAFRKSYEPWRNLNYDRPR